MELWQYLLREENIETLRSIGALLQLPKDAENTSTNNKLPNELNELLNQAIEESERGNVEAHEKVWKELQQQFNLH